VVADQVIGAVGSSGNASEPLLCLALSQTVMDPPVSVPVGFSDVVVSLNPGADPWARHLASWNIHEGFLVQRAK
jgi:murein DD-endopeptidase MepM/ murein hydrolase activator NlpD